jgi:hypothetical protein
MGGAGRDGTTDERQIRIEIALTANYFHELWMILAITQIDSIIV